MLLKPLEDADVRQPQRAAALQRNADHGAARRLDLRQGWGQSGAGWGGIHGFLRHGGRTKQNGGKQGRGRLPAHGYTPR